MHDYVQTIANLTQLGVHIADIYTRRLMAAEECFVRSWLAAAETIAKAPSPTTPDPWSAWNAYVTDWWERSVLTIDTLRRRGNNFLEHERAGNPPVLAFQYETIIDGRTLSRSVNYALVRIIPPAGTAVDNNKRPFVIIDPRAGHGPGIGGFKQNSQVGVALQAGHPVYFVIFFPEPVPGQTIVDVCEAEGKFIQAVADRHPQSPKPALIGNCQGGWASMMIAASRPEVTGPLVINGAPMSYWSGSWQGGEGENPMRYSGGLLGGTWLALWTSDLSNGKFDGAHLVTNFEKLNLSNTLWTKYYHLFANVDTEPPRFLEFERWWGGYSLMNEEEIRWIVENLFIGNRLARGEVRGSAEGTINLKDIRSPMIIFSSNGDNITPPQQALNWISDVYSSTEEIKANGQVIVGLLHADVGHLGIFASGRVARKEHAQIVEVLKHIESLRPGLYVMEIDESTDAEGRPVYAVSIEPRRLEDLRRLNRLERKDEQAFAVVADVSTWLEKSYVLLARPWVRLWANEPTAELGRIFHPLRSQRWSVSDLNPWVWWVPAVAASVRSDRHSAPIDNPFRCCERAGSQLIAASLDLIRDLRDATMEANFFRIYGPWAVLQSTDSESRGEIPSHRALDDVPQIRAALARIGVGGYPEALALMGALIGHAAGPITPAKLELIDQSIQADRQLRDLPPDIVRQLKAVASVIAELEPERGLESLPRLLAQSDDRVRAIGALDAATKATELTDGQLEWADRIRTLLTAAEHLREGSAPDLAASELTVTV